MSRKKWYKGHIGRFWDTSYKHFDYKRPESYPGGEEELEKWKLQGYDYVKNFYGGLYTNENPMPEWTDQVKNLFELKNMTMTFHRMETLDIMPEHKDHYTRYRKMFNADYQNINRVLLMLEDWKPGHYLEIDGVGIVNWLAGDYFVWENSTPHSAANIGVEPRYTLQITGEKAQGKDVWRKLHWYNIPNLKTKKESEKEPYIYHIVKKCFLGNKKPTYIYMYNGNIDELKEIDHDEETIKELNNTGIDFYLYEPLCSYKHSEIMRGNSTHPGHTNVFYSEFTGNDHPWWIRADELDSILDYATRNKLTNITVHSCDYNIDKCYPYYSDKIKLTYDDLHNKTCLPKIVADDEFQPEFTKKFISPMWRYTPHRHLIAAALAPLSSHISWYHKAEFFTIAQGEWYNYHKWKDSPETMDHFNKMIVGIQHLNRNVPINLDMNIQEAILIRDKNNFKTSPNDSLYTNLKEIIDGDNNALEIFYSDSFCDIVTESRFAQPTGNFSEKSFQPMWFKKPFILAAPPYTLEALKKEGFKTFSDFWDESYDEEEIHEQRLFKIFDLIDFINSKSIAELREMYEEMKPILLHNYYLLQKLLPVEK